MIYKTLDIRWCRTKVPEKGTREVSPVILAAYCIRSISR
jgi:hypothetical protein